MGWNRERIVFALSLMVLLGSLMHGSATFLGTGIDLPALSEPAPAPTGLVGGDVSIDWYEEEPRFKRDPFETMSEWRLARPDPLASPPYGPLKRRIPLPGPVARTPRAWPGLEESPPENSEGGGE